jgi:hypothetical protein
MWRLLKRNREECSRLLESLETASEVDAISPKLTAHAASCAACQTASEDLIASRKLLAALPRRAETAGSWFASRVMAAIAARESELMRSVEAWTVLPKLAARLTWISALALLLTTTWLVGRPPAATPARPVLTDLAGDPVVENVPAPVNNDEVLVSLGEKAR